MFQPNSNTIENTINYNRPLTMIKDRDKRCGRNCIINWTKFNQKVPKYQICECNKNNILIKNK
jgi:hypothetical protein